MVGFSEPLDPATPAGGSAVSGGDDAIRQFKRAILERIGTLVTDVNANPWTLKTAAVAPAGPAASQQIVVHASSSHIGSQVGTSNPPPYGIPGANGEIWNPQATDGMMVALSIPLPGSTGGSIVTIKRIEVLGQRADAATIFRFTPKIISALGAPTNLPTSNMSGTGTQTIDSGNLNQVVPQGGSLIVHCEVGPAAIGATFLKLARVTYDLG